MLTFTLIGSLSCLSILLLLSELSRVLLVKHSTSLLIFDLKRKLRGRVLVSNAYLSLEQVKLRLDLPRRVRNEVNIEPPAGARNRRKTLLPLLYLSNWSRESLIAREEKRGITPFYHWIRWRRWHMLSGWCFVPGCVSW